MSAPLTSSLDLTNGDNVVQARHELHRATDFGTDADLIAWVRKWGDASLAAAEKAAADFDPDGWGWGSTIESAVERGLALCLELYKVLESDAPDMAQVRQISTQIRSRFSAINEALDVDQ